MGDVNLEIKLSNLDERVIKIEESGGGSGGDDYITSVSNDFNVVNKKLLLSNDVTTKLSKVDTPDNLSVELAKKIDKPASATDGQVLTYNATSGEWEAKDSQGGSITEPTELEKGIIGGDAYVIGKTYSENETCIYNNKIYVCKATTTSLPTDTTYWKVISLKSLNENSGTGKDIYTTNEQEIGTWVDGKPIYRCMWYSDNCNYSSPFKISSAITRQNVDTLIKGMGSIDDGTNYQPLNRSGYYNGEVAVYPMLKNDGLYMHVAQSTVKRYVLILEYTKK